MTFMACYGLFHRVDDTFFFRFRLIGHTEDDGRMSYSQCSQQVHNSIQ